MQWHLKIADDGSRLTMAAWGVAEVEPFQDFLQKALEHPDFRPGMQVCLDLRRLDSGALTMNDVQRLADLHKPHAEALASVRIAVVVTRSLDYEAVRLWEALVHEPHLAHDVFFSLEEAESWLQGG